MLSQQQACWNILLIDEDYDDFLILHGLLKDQRGEGFQLSSLISEQEIFKRIRENQLQADVALVEFDLFNRSGLEMIAILKRLAPQLPCILFTDWRQPDLEELALASGAQGLLRKSNLDGAALCQCIQQIISRVGERDGLGDGRNY